MNTIGKIRAEIVRLMQNEITHNSNGVVTGEFRVNARQLMDFLDTIEEKSEKPINQDELEKEIEAQLSIFPYTKVSPELPESRWLVIRKELSMFARHFAQWSAEHSGSSEIPKDLEEAARRYGFEEYMRRCNGGEYGTSEDAFIAGAEWVYKNADHLLRLQGYIDGRIDAEMEFAEKFGIVIPPKTPKK